MNAQQIGTLVSGKSLGSGIVGMEGWTIVTYEWQRFGTVTKLSQPGTRIAEQC